MKTVVHSHNNGSVEVKEDVISGVFETIQSVSLPLKRNCARNLRTAILDGLRVLGWSDRVHIRAKLKLTLTAINGSSGLCLQTGNMARFYADLLKLQVAYMDGKIKAAVYILPTKDASKQIGSNVASYERMIKELSVLQSIITVPIVVIGFYK